MNRRARRIGLEAWESERQMNELNESLARASDREKIAVKIARDSYGSDDVEIDEYDHEKLFIESVDGGYWVKARVWVDAEAVEGLMGRPHRT